MLSKLFSQEPLFWNTRNFVHCSVYVVEGDCSMHIVKHISSLYNNFAAESLLERRI